MSERELDRAHRLVELGRYDDAARVARGVLGGDPENVEALSVLAVTLTAVEDWPRAVTTANRLVTAAPDSAGAHRLASLALQGDAQHEEAVRAAQSAVRLDPHDAENFVQLALAAQQVRSRRPEARRAAQEAVRLAPYDDDAHFAVGLTSRRRKAKREAYHRALALNPAHASAANNELVARGRVWSLRSLVDGYLGVLGSDPGFDVAKENLVALTYRFARRYYFAGFLLLLIALAHAAVTDSFERGSLVRAAVGVLALVLMVAYAVAMWRAVPYGPRLHLVRAWRGRPMLIAYSLLAVVVDAAGLVALLVPGAVDAALGFGVLLVYANVALALVAGAVGLVRRGRR